jgi:A/G-specific adenine glycosylase
LPNLLLQNESLKLEKPLCSKAACCTHLLFDPPMPSSFAEKLLRWYEENARELPWRGHPDPYAVWVSEIMLQQTRVETVIAYHQNWMKALPTIAALAAASQQAVLSLWEGLGYYSRARNLHKAARMIMEKYDGKLPKDVKSLMELPGIGRYTAAAIASIAFGKDEPTLDGNIRRVFSRVFNVSEPAGSSQGEKTLWWLGKEHLPPGKAGDFNQALMDLGATLCTPKNPDCPGCPAAEVCKAYQLGLQEERPVPKPKKEIPHHTVTAAIIERDGKVLITQRPQKGLLGGLWEFPGGKQEPGEDLIACLHREICEELEVDIQVGKLFGTYHHAYTHFRVTLHAYLCRMNGGEPDLKEHTGMSWAEVGELSNFPMGKIDRQIATQLANRLPVEATDPS